MIKNPEFIMFGTATSPKKLQTTHIRVGTHIINRVDSVRNIGAIFDEQMRMEKQVGQLCKSAWLYLYKISKILQYLTTDQEETMVHAFVTTKLDLNNSLLAGLPGYVIHRLQLVQNAAAKTVADLKTFEHVTHVLQNLNWLPVEKRIMFKLLLLCYKALNGAGPGYPKDMTQIAEPKRTGLRSGDNVLHLERPQTRLITVGDRAFSFAAIDLWNKLPLKLRDSKTGDTFKSYLKTYLFKYKSKYLHVYLVRHYCDIIFYSCVLLDCFYVIYKFSVLFIFNL